MQREKKLFTKGKKAIREGRGKSNMKATKKGEKKKCSE